MLSKFSLTPAKPIFCIISNDYYLKRFVPPLTLPFRRRRVIQSIFLRVQRK